MTDANSEEVEALKRLNWDLSRAISADKEELLNEILDLRARVAPVASEPIDWKQAAQALGEYLGDCGPDQYYSMTAEQWLMWAKPKAQSLVAREILALVAPVASPALPPSSQGLGSQLNLATPVPVASKSVEDVMARADEYAVRWARDDAKYDEKDEVRNNLQAAIVAYGDERWTEGHAAAFADKVTYGDAQWSAGRDAAAKEIEANNWPHYMAEVVRELKR